jgi:phage gp36-like protein
MRYASIDRVTRGIPETSLIQLSNDDPEATIPDLAVIQEIVGNVEDVIDDHLRGRYTLPLEAVPTTVATIAIKLARHDLYSRRPETEVPKDVVREYDGAMKMLASIRDGKLTLGIEATQAVQPEPGAARVRASDRAFPDATLDQY